MIRVDEEDPVGEIELSFPYRDVQIKKGIEPKELYDLKSELGRGKFGTVYRCTEKSSGLQLAAKFISIIKKEDRRNVEREVEIMKSLQHPRLLQIYDALENGKTMCVILELIEGGELFERVIDDDFVLTEKSCTAFMRQICEGVDFIHKQKILHLDMKPENILCLTKTGNRIKIIDFGLARRYDPDKKLQVLFGTPEFVAPEVVNFDQIGYGTDMWSVGVICYVLLSGLSPFMGHTDVETMANVTVGKYDFDDDAFKEISENAQDFIAKLLVKDISSRMSAEDCLKHAWLLRRPTPQVSHMDVAKDNLKLFVDRWNEHPNSPYVFEAACQIIAPCSAREMELSQSFHSLEGMSPSPCGSIVSSVGSDNTFIPNNVSEEVAAVSNSDHIRRASDSTYVMKMPDVVERLNLADEIRKLTDRLFQLSSTPVEFKTNTETINRSSPIAIKGHGNKLEIPWRRSKLRITTNSRDVPLSPKNDINSFCKQFQTDVASINTYKTRSLTTSTTISGSIEETANGTKDMLLRLLEQWDGPPSVPPTNTRHNSVSSEWNENENLGQRTISSLNLFFQSRTTNKKNHPFMKANGFK